MSVRPDRVTKLNEVVLGLARRQRPHRARELWLPALRCGCAGCCCVPKFVVRAADLTGPCPCDTCSCHEITTQHRPGPVTRGGDVYTWGSPGIDDTVSEDGSEPALGRGCCLGHGDGVDVPQPRQVHNAAFEAAAAAGRGVVRVTCGEDHTIAVGRGGGTWAWGRGERGQLGCGDARLAAARPVAMQLVQEVMRRGAAERPPEVSSVGCGHGHTVMALCDGRVVTFGRGSEGQLGYGDVEDQPMPQLVQVRGPTQ
jgi:alpha-tubulin suppressor-like RCC1 family protein